MDVIISNCVINLAADKGQVLREAFRVLKPGGRFFCLEFSHVVLPTLAKIYDRYSFTMLPLLSMMTSAPSPPA